MGRSTLGLVVFCLALGAPAANASQIISTTGVSGLRLGVDAKGEAMLTYTAQGKVVHVLAWGAVNAIAPTPTGKQVAFKLAYDGGFQKYYTQNPAARAA